MCMELSYRGHVDHLPGSLPQDSSFFYKRREVMASDEAMEVAIADLNDECMCDI